MKKTNRNITIDTLKSLLARSGNQCAFPNCTHPIFNDNNLLVAQLCHIEAVSPKGQRYNLNKPPNEVNSYKNLLFLCYRHHKETDNIDEYPVEKLKEIKAKHEVKFKEYTFAVDEAALNLVLTEINSYWTSIEDLNSNHVAPEFKIEINTKQDILGSINEIKDLLSRINDINNVFQEELKTNYFEYVCLALPNFLSRIHVLLNQIEIKHMEELLLKNPQSEELKKAIEELRRSFAITAQSGGLAD